jgi:hypothetical protein
MPYIILLFSIACGAYVIYDVWTENKRLDETQKLVWTIAAIFLSILTAIIYYFSFKRRQY